MRRRTTPKPVAAEVDDAELTVRTDERRLVMWMPHGRVFTAFFQGETVRAVILRRTCGSR
jgi:hypothetical protein